MIKTIEEFRRLIPTVTGDSIEKYKSLIAEAALWLRTKIVGGRLMDRIELLEAGDELYDYAARVVAYNAYLRSIPLMDVIETDNGFAVVNDEKLAPASATRVENLIKGIRENLNEALERLIECLEDTPDLHADWSESPAFTIMYDSLIPTLRMFRRYGQFEGSYFEFIDSVPEMRAIITEKIEPAISREFMAQLLGEVRNNDISIYADIVEQLRRAMGAFYNRKETVGQRLVNQVREQLMREPDNYPVFRGSALYELITREQKKDDKYKSILVIL